MGHNAQQILLLHFFQRAIGFDAAHARQSGDFGLPRQAFLLYQMINNGSLFLIQEEENRVEEGSRLFLCFFQVAVSNG